MPGTATRRVQRSISRGKASSIGTENIEHLIHAYLEDWEMSAEEVTAAMNVLMNQGLFTTGHKSPKLQKAYEAARSARFEHGEFPWPSR